MAAEKKGKVILAYSGGLDTSVAIPWLHEQGYEVVTLTMHVGQQADNLEEIKEKAYVAGARRLRRRPARGLHRHLRMARAQGQRDISGRISAQLRALAPDDSPGAHLVR